MLVFIITQISKECGPLRGYSQAQVLDAYKSRDMSMKEQYIFDLEPASEVF